MARNAAEPEAGRRERDGARGPYRRARRDRGAETRARLIEAALDVFGRVGFEGATTREIAKAADANLAAIVYHFGSKEALHRAVAEHVVGEIAGRIAGPVAEVEDRLDGLDAAGARAALIGLVQTFIDVILGADEAERWARFIVREQLQPTASFDVIYGFMSRAHGVATRLVAIASGGRAGEHEAKLRAFTLLGQVLIFRVAQELVLRRLGRDRIGPAERSEIKAIVAGNISAVLSSLGGADASA